MLFRSKDYEGSNYIWVEDKPINAEDGLKYGLQCFLMDHAYNQEYVNPDVQRVNSWYQIAQCLLKVS